jgi:phage gp46-like protein
MDCNQVFMILTRGPFPTGELWDEDVETHLETCADCWRLAEALRPALEVFQEAVPPAESRELPGYWGDARPASSVVSELHHRTSRVATAYGVRRMARPYQRQYADPVSSSSTAEVWRAVILASTVTATAVGLGLVWWLA